MSEENIVKLAILMIGGVGGSILTILTKIADSKIKRHDDNIRRLATHKQNVVREVLKVVREGKNCNYWDNPKDIIYNNNVSDDLKGVDSKMGITMNNFLFLWIKIAVAHIVNNKTGKNKEYLNSQYSQIKIEQEKLIEWINKNR